MHGDIQIMNYIIRIIQPEDIGQVFGQMQALVKHEGLEASFKLTAERMANELFGPLADWQGLVAAQGDIILGFCFYSFANTNRAFNLTPLIQIDDLFVQAKYRGFGIAKNLLQELAKIAYQKKIERIELWCLRSNAEGQAFYQTLKAEKLDFLDVLLLDVAKLMAKSEP